MCLDPQGPVSRCSASVRSVSWRPTRVKFGSAGSGSRRLVTRLGCVAPPHGVVVQTPALLEERTVHENVALAARHALGMSTSDADQRATSLLSDLNLRHLSKQRAAGLGPGIAKAVALARALAVGAQTLILDEPTTGLDPIQAMVVDEAITDAVRSEGVSALVISHDLESMKKVADRAILLYDGGIRVRGTPSELLNHEDEIWQQFQAGRAEGPL